MKIKVINETTLDIDGYPVKIFCDAPDFIKKLQHIQECIKVVEQLPTILAQLKNIQAKVNSLKAKVLDKQ